jgi:hypothetical protein
MPARLAVAPIERKDISHIVAAVHDVREPSISHAHADPAPWGLWCGIGVLPLPGERCAAY